LRDTWDGTFLAHVHFALALPRLNDQQTLAPSLRGQPATISSCLGNATLVVKMPVIKLPKRRLPNLFK